MHSHTGGYSAIQFNDKMDKFKGATTPLKGHVTGKWGATGKAKALSTDNTYLEDTTGPYAKWAAEDKQTMMDDYVSTDGKAPPKNDVQGQTKDITDRTEKAEADENDRYAKALYEKGVEGVGCTRRLRRLLQSCSSEREDGGLSSSDSLVEVTSN